MKSSLIKDVMTETKLMVMVVVLLAKFKLALFVIIFKAFPDVLNVEMVSKMQVRHAMMLTLMMEMVVVSFVQFKKIMNAQLPSQVFVPLYPHLHHQLFVEMV